MHEKLQEDDVCTEAIHEMLVDNLKQELCRVTPNSQDECYLEVEDIKNNIDKEFYLDIKEEHFEGREKVCKREDAYEMKNKIGQEIETEPVNSDLLCRIFDEQINLIDLMLK